jgi:hypothetical protein
VDPRQKEASQLASEALDDALAGRFVEAEPKIRAAVELAATTRHHSLPMFRGQLAAVLRELDRDDEALHTYELSVRDALDMYALDSSGVVSVCRYFLGEHLLRMGRASDALQCVLPSLLPENPHGPLRLVEAVARWNIGQLEQARTAAQLAVQYARTPAQADGFRERLGELVADQEDS